MQRLAYQTIGAFLILLLTIVVPIYVYAASDPNVIGRVVWVKGKLEAFQPNQPHRILKRSDVIYEKDTLMTDKITTGQIVFTDNSVMSLRENSVIEISEYNYKNPTAKENHFLVNVVKGGFRTITGMISKQNHENYKAKTPVATIGVLGTQYSIYYTQGASGLVAKLDRGAIVIKNKAGQITLTKCAAGAFGCTNNIFARVTAENQPPKILQQKPVEFTKDVKVTETSFKAASNVPPPGGSGSSNTTTPTPTANPTTTATSTTTTTTISESVANLSSSGGEKCPTCTGDGFSPAKVNKEGVVSSFCIK